MDVPLHWWIAFNLFVLAMLALDLGIFHRKEHTVSIKEALVWCAVWVSLALSFNVGIYFWRGPEKALEFLTGYILEKSLSMDNVFVFAVIFTYMAVPAADQHKVLFWGVLGALIMRAAFFVRREGRRLATPLLLVLLMVETTDVLFATDSIPAVFAVTQDPFIVYTSNIFAILGLRALYFVLAGAITKFRYLRPGLSVILIFVGVKMLAVHYYKLPIVLSLGIICGILAVAIGASLWERSRSEQEVLTGKD